MQNIWEVYGNKAVGIDEHKWFNSAPQLPADQF